MIPTLAPTITIQIETPTGLQGATVVRSLSKGMVTFSMEICRYTRVPQKLAEEIIAGRRE